MPKTKPWRKLYDLDLSSSFAGLDSKVRAAAYLLLGERADDHGIVGRTKERDKEPADAVLRGIYCEPRSKQWLRLAVRALLEDGWLTVEGGEVRIRNFRRFQATASDRPAKGQRTTSERPANDTRTTSERPTNDQRTTSNEGLTPRNHSGHTPPRARALRTEQNRTELTSSDDDVRARDDGGFESCRRSFVREWTRRYGEATACGFSAVAHDGSISAIVAALMHSPGSFDDAAQQTLDRFFADEYVRTMRNPFSIKHLERNVAKYRHGWNEKRPEEMSAAEREQAVARAELKRELEVAEKLGINPDPDYIADLRRKAGLKGDEAWN